MTNSYQSFLSFFKFIIIPLLAGLSIFISSSSLFAAGCPHCDGLREDCQVARAGAGGSSGKWNDDVTPKRGWSCTSAEDLGSGSTQECEMCEREQVRYVHHMSHGETDIIHLAVGCICAGHMEGREEGEAYIADAIRRAHDRTRNLTNRAARRANFPNLTAWKVSRKGNTTLNKDGTWITIIKSRYNHYAARVGQDLVGGWVPTERQAKLNAFDHLYPARVE